MASDRDARTPSSQERNALGPTGHALRENIARIRNARGLSYSDLAALLREGGRTIERSALRRVERGERRVDADDLVAIAVALNVTVDALLRPFGHRDARLSGRSDPVSFADYLAWESGKAPLPVGSEHEIDSEIRALEFHRHSDPPR